MTLWGKFPTCLSGVGQMGKLQTCPTVEARRTLKRPKPSGPKGPELLSEVLSRLFAARGWGRRQERLHLEEAWADAVGPEHAANTRLAGLRCGVLEVEVNSAILLQELAQFHKRKVLERLRKRLPRTTLTDVRFRAGTWQK